MLFSSPRHPAGHFRKNSTMTNETTAQTPNQNDSASSNRRLKQVAAGGAVAVGIFVAALTFVSTRDDNTESAEAPAATETEQPEASVAPVAPTESLGGEPASDQIIGSSNNDELLREIEDEGFPDEDAEDFFDLDEFTGLNESSDPDDAIDFLDDDPFATYNQAILDSVCLTKEHADTESYAVVDGKISNVEDGSMYLEGPTFNGGVGIEIPVTAGVFNARLPVTVYGDHEITRFELTTGGPGGPPVDLMPSMLAGPGTVLPIGPGDGPIFDQECIEFTPAELAGIDEVFEEEANGVDTGAPVADGDVAPDANDAMFEQQRLTEEAARTVTEFMNGFVEDHRSGDAANLQETLHPAIRLAYGDDVCSEYIDRTAGSISGVTIVAVGVPQSLDMNTPSGPINFPQAIPFTVEFEVTDGSTFVNDGHLPLHDGGAHWLTTCGVEAP